MLKELLKVMVEFRTLTPILLLIVLMAQFTLHDEFTSMKTDVAVIKNDITYLKGSNKNATNN